MKLRWVIKNTGGKTIDSWLGKIVTEDYYEKVLQQWWEVSRLKPEYEGLPFVFYDGSKPPPDLHETYGEWRDVEIEEENERP